MSVVLDESGRIIGYSNPLTGEFEIPMEGNNVYQNAFGTPLIYSPEGAIPEPEAVAAFGVEGLKNIKRNQAAAVRAGDKSGGYAGAMVGAGGAAASGASGGFGGILLLAGAALLAWKMLK